jgi:3-oxoacyl-[acyl-carrier-protein] synthase-3
MHGREVYRHAVERMTAAGRTLLEENGLAVQDVDYFVPHQANARIVHAVSDALGVSRERVTLNLERTANTSAHPSRWHSRQQTATDS